MRLEHGHCFCGAIEATFEGDPFWICFDHDDDCRRAIGSPLTIWIGYQAAQVNFRRGEPATFSKTRGIVRFILRDVWNLDRLRRRRPSERSVHLRRLHARAGTVCSRSPWLLGTASSLHRHERWPAEDRNLYACARSVTRNAARTRIESATTIPSA